MVERSAAAADRRAEALTLTAASNVYLLLADYTPWRYLWPREGVGAPQRLRDVAVLERRGGQLNVVLSSSRSDADTL